MRIKKKGTSGAAKNYITRTQAVKKLQVSLADFRRLCIFKGIYPREPRNKKKANKGSTAPTTFYYTKDIQYLMHEPVLAKFREHKIFARKLSRALGRGEVGDAKRLDDNRPRYKLDHIIKERYPTFLDALRDLDDPLSMLFLFAALPATDKVSYRITQDAERLCNEWMAYVAREKLLRKVFVSIKGVYYQARIRGQNIMWLVPFKFPQNVPSDVDFRIMLTFLEFYTTLLQFVLYRLYVESNFVYPPTVDNQKLKGVGGIKAYVLESRKPVSLLPEVGRIDANTKGKPAKKLELDKAVAADNNDEDEQEDEQHNEAHNLDTFSAIPPTKTAPSDVLVQPVDDDDQVNNLFGDFTFFIGREVPLDLVEFLILSFGGQTISESALDELIDNENENESNSKPVLDQVDMDQVTHQICDRPSIASKVAGRTYVQPQWIFDSINKGTLLSVAEYAPGETLPPHLSPWGDSAGYNPEQALEPEQDEDSDESADKALEDQVEGPIEADEEEEEDDEEVLEAQKELEKEAAGIKYSEQKTADDKKEKKRKRTAADEEQEEKELRKIMMSNKQKKLYNKMQYGIDKKNGRQEALREKRRKLEETKSKLKN